jgi:hypothetical protein
MHRHLLPLLFAVSLPATSLAQNAVDPFEDAMRESVKFYRVGKISEAKEALAKARELLDQKQAKAVGSTFPDAPAGWTAGETVNEDLPAAFGGGRVVRKTYASNQGRKDLVVEVIYDAPTIRMLIGLAANDQIAEAQGFKVRRANAERVLVKENGPEVELNMPVDDRILVKIVGKGGATEDEAMKLLREIDRRSLKDMK